MGEDGRPDMVNRDPNSLNDNLTVRFEEVIGEPESAHTPECAYHCGFKCYEGCLGCCYKLQAFLCTWLIGCCWGCGFAVAVFNQIWCITPCFKFMTQWFTCARSLLSMLFECVIGPCCAAIGMVCTNIKVTNISG